MLVIMFISTDHNCYAYEEVNSAADVSLLLYMIQRFINTI